MAEEKKRKCTVCGKPSSQMICDNCKAQIQADAAGEKKKSEKGVDVGSQVIADKTVGHKN